MNSALGDRERAMVAAARLVAHYVDAALRAGADRGEIGAVLADIRPHVRAVGNLDHGRARKANGN